MYNSGFGIPVHIYEETFAEQTPGEVFLQHSLGKIQGEQPDKTSCYPDTDR